MKEIRPKEEKVGLSFAFFGPNLLSLLDDESYWPAVIFPMAGYSFHLLFPSFIGFIRQAVVFSFISGINLPDKSMKEERIPVT